MDAQSQVQVNIVFFLSFVLFKLPVDILVRVDLLYLVYKFKGKLFQKDLCKDTEK